MKVLQTVLDGVAVGAIFALVAVGLALIFGVLRLINFAHGELITAGAYSLYLTRDLPVWTSIVICFITCIVLAVVIEAVALRPLRGAAPMTTLVATFAIAFALQAVWVIAFSPLGRVADPLSGLNTVATHGALTVRWVTIVEIVAGIALLGGTALLLNRTNVGLQMRAAATDFRAARLLGVKANRVIRFSFVLAGVMAAVVALLLTVQQPSVSPTYGLNITVLALVGAVLGGVDRLETATFGGFAIGFVTSLFGDVVPNSQTEFVTAYTYLFVGAALLVRPAGLFARSGQAPVERV